MAKYVSKEDIVSKIQIVDLAQEFCIALEKVSSGNFDYRCKCPSSEHKNGSERTGSCYIDSKRNNFYCYGCNLHSSSIDFFMACKGITFSEAMSLLKERLPPSEHVTVDIEPNNFFVLLEISKLFRETMLTYPEEIPWINKLMKYSDEIIFDLNSNEDDKAKMLLSKLKNKINKRINK